MKKEKHPTETKKETIIDDEPSWYHYVIILLVFAAIIVAISTTISLFTKDTEKETDPLTITYKYPYTLGNITYNIYLHTPIEDLIKLNYPIEPNKLDIFNTIDFTLVFDTYNNTDNRYVTTASTKLMRFLKIVYKFQFDEENFRLLNETNCSMSSKRNKIITFNPYSNQTAITINQQNGCIEIQSQTPQEIVSLTDKLIATIIQ